MVLRAVWSWQPKAGYPLGALVEGVRRVQERSPFFEVSERTNHCLPTSVDMHYESEER